MVASIRPIIRFGVQSRVMWRISHLNNPSVSLESRSRLLSSYVANRDFCSQKPEAQVFPAPGGGVKHLSMPPLAISLSIPSKLIKVPATTLVDFIKNARLDRRSWIMVMIQL